MMRDVILRAMIAYLERPSGALYFNGDDPERATIDGYMLNLRELAAAIETAIKAEPPNEASGAIQAVIKAAVKMAGEGDWTPSVAEELRSALRDGGWIAPDPTE